MTSIRPLGVLSFAFLLGVAAPESAEAGCVILKNGEVLVGKIRKGDVTEDHITVRWPYKDRTERGEIEIPTFRIRWFDVKADEPSDEYWEEHGDNKIDSEWVAVYEKWRIRKRARSDAMEGDFFLTAETFLSKASLSPIPVENGNIKIQKPEGWTSTIDEDGITIFTTEKAGSEGYRARIHVFSVKSAFGQTEDQVKWVEQRVAILAGPDGTFEVRERKRLRAKAGGFDQEMLTLTRRLSRPILTLRKMLFRKKNTYFFAAYAHERDYTGLELLFKACMRSLEIKEDAASKRKL